MEVVEVELARRRGRAVEHVCRSRAVAERYTRLHPAVYTLSVRHRLDGCGLIRVGGAWMDPLGFEI